MSSDRTKKADKAARAKRSDQLHRQIDELKKGPAEGEALAQEETGSRGQSPRAFIQRRMRDLANKPKA